MHREKHLLPRVIDLANLQRGFIVSARAKRHQPEVQAFAHDLETHLWEMRREVEAGAYRWGPYRRFLIHDPKRREIRAAPFRDRVLHHAIFNVLDPIVRRGFIADTYACIPGRGTHRAVHRYREFVRRRGGRGHLLQCDVRRYFASVDHGVLLGLLARRIGDGAMLSLLASLVVHGAEAPGRGMPIGNLTSQLFANLYLDPFDHFVKETLRVRHYVRYMDDFVLLADDREEARRLLAAVETFLGERLHLVLARHRTVIAPLAAPRDFLGYVHFLNRRVRVRRRSVRRLWRRIPELSEGLSSGVLAGSAVRSSLASWLGLAAHADAFRLSRAIFRERDAGNLGKRLAVQALGRAAFAPSAPRADLSCAASR